MHVCVGLMASDHLNKMDIIKENRLLTITTDNHQCQTHRFAKHLKVIPQNVCVSDENKLKKKKKKGVALI